MNLWTRNLAHIRKLDGWARDARFYFVCRRFLKRWQAASLESKKQKRRDAYMQVRRKSKMSLAACALRRWCVVSAQVHNMQHEANLIYQTQLFRVGTKLFDHWKRQLDLRVGQSHQAAQHYDRRQVERHLYTWMERLEHQSKLEDMAEFNNEMRVKNVAFGWFHKLRIRLIELRGREANAANLRKWYEKRHAHNLLRKWQEKAARKLDRPQQEKAFSPRTSSFRPRAGNDSDEPTRRAEDWTEFDIGDWIPALEAQSSITPLPGYLSTPSKRAARAKAMARISTTPAGTPFEHRLRSQLGSTRTSKRVGFGLSATTLRGSTFGVILENSPRTPKTGTGTGMGMGRGE